MPENERVTHDIVVVGASAGGVQALVALVSTLPADLDATVFVALHVPSYAPSVLPTILSRRGALLATHAEDGEPVERGRIYVAPPDWHLLLAEGRMQLERGPKENGHRPAIDALFRSAAAAYGPRVVGVVLSGALGDGSLGLREIKARGGLAMVQDPGEALYSSMPRTAIDAVRPDLVAPAAELGRLLGEVVRTPVPTQRDLEEAMHEVEMEEVEGGASGAAQNGQPSSFGCPDCGGVLWSENEQAARAFRCRVGHAIHGRATPCWRRWASGSRRRCGSRCARSRSGRIC